MRSTLKLFPKRHIQIIPSLNVPNLSDCLCVNPDKPYVNGLILQHDCKVTSLYTDIVC